MAFYSVLDLVKSNSQIFAINIPDLRVAHWLLKFSHKHNRPVILQISQRVLEYEGVEIIKILKNLISTMPAVASLHLDHCTDFELCKDAIDAGIGGILFDGSKLDFDTNIKLTSQLKKIAQINHVFIEGEINSIPGEEDGHNWQNAERLVSLNNAIHFISKTNVDGYAPYFGNHHGDYVSNDKQFNFTYLQELASSIQTPIVIHGGSGITKKEAKIIKNIGFGKINFSTDFKKVLKNNDNSLDPFSNSVNLEKAMLVSFKNLIEIWAD